MDEWGLIYDFICDRMMKWCTVMLKWNDDGWMGRLRRRRSMWAWLSWWYLSVSLTALCSSFFPFLVLMLPFLLLSAYFFYPALLFHVFGLKPAWNFLGFTQTNLCDQTKSAVGNLIPSQEAMLFKKCVNNGLRERIKCLTKKKNTL